MMDAIRRSKMEMLSTAPTAGRTGNGNSPPAWLVVVVLMAASLHLSCSRAESQRAKLLQKAFQTYQPVAGFGDVPVAGEDGRMLNAYVYIFSLKTDAQRLSASGALGTQKDLVLGCLRHAEAMVSAMRARNQVEAASHALSACVAAQRVFEGLQSEAGTARAPVPSSPLSAGEPPQPIPLTGPQLEVRSFAARVLGAVVPVCFEALTQMALYAPSTDRMSIFESMARAYPAAPGGSTQQGLSGLMQLVYRKEDRRANRSRMGELLQQLGIPLPSDKVDQQAPAVEP